MSPFCELEQNTSSKYGQIFKFVTCVTVTHVTNLKIPHFSQNLCQWVYQILVSVPTLIFEEISSEIELNSCPLYHKI